MNRQWFWILFGLLLLWRLLHFGPEIDLPHDWRQAETAFYIWDFYQNGIDLMNPAVCWMGGYERVILECPLPEAMVALLYQGFGENILFARLVFFLFFLGSLYYLYRITCLLWDVQWARWTTIVYLALPLSWFYSRAIHIDFSAILAAHAMLFYYLRGINERRTLDFCWSSLWAIFAFLIKAPYAFYFALPMLVYACSKKAFWWMMQRAVIFALPIVFFVAWQQYVYLVNGQAPDWEYILHYRKFDNNNHWYFGHWTRRLDLYAWKILTLRGLLEVTGLGGLLLFLLALTKMRLMPQLLFWLSWAVGTIVYVLIFFNLNVIHNYYQLPLLAPVALLIAYGLHGLYEKHRRYALPALLVLIIGNGAFTEWKYYEVPHQLIEIGQLIRDHTDTEDLVIITYQKFDCRNPRILYRARRRGWSIEELALSDQVLQNLIGEGARVWAYIGPHIPKGIEVAAFSKPEILPLETSEDRLFLFSLEGEDGKR